MVRFTVSVLSLGVIASLTAAAPNPGPVSGSVGAVVPRAPDGSFSWATWVEDIIANPNDTHLNPQEAVEAAAKSGQSAVSTKRDTAFSLLEKRLTCQFERCRTIEAARIVNYLASIGGQDCVVRYGSGDMFSRWNVCEAFGVTNQWRGTKSPCLPIASPLFFALSKQVGRQR
ncbi:hypothetical protein MAPG_06908 [Magnaporthiopsis poae ATCC 64411]|uniref:Uncharacterized protein n=1 Tax=Magnaporthiopsis poae (strain ATCC 64411 / 73-15) TaxID=644358 RepID=A0A0C4E3B1_MAGP6|nr:hypothetical protein MAPG_06908 [Magnaporthiopsis poae ATCC 64411]